MNVFDKAKKKETKKEIKKTNDKLTIVVDNKEITDAITTMEKTSKILKEAKADHEMAKGIINECAKDEYSKIYEKEKRNVGSFNIESGGNTVLFAPSKRYIKLDQESADELTECYGEDVVDEKIKTDEGFIRLSEEVRMCTIA